MQVVNLFEPGLPCLYSGINNDNLLGLFYSQKKLTYGDGPTQITSQNMVSTLTVCVLSYEVYKCSQCDDF